MMFPFVREALSHLFSKPSTERYPLVKKEVPEGFRGKIAFYPEKCTNCGLCMRVCASLAIEKTVEKTEEGDLITLSFDLSSCTFCQMCADFCSRKAIELTREFSMVAEDANDLIVVGTFLKAPPVKKVAPAETQEAIAAPSESTAEESEDKDEE